ncbi:MAG: phosphoribosylanthranilate isomerase [Acidimicrobiales bacterium]|nr:phosphoribosylanthranilate isomerase [Acidimicrobiales bacterium]
MFVKICAVTEPSDAALAAEFGADAVGMIFAPSPRRVDVPQAREIAAALPEHVSSVGVFRDHLAGEVIDIAAEVGLDGAQLHGAETPATSVEVGKHVRFVIRAMAAGDPQLVDIDDHRADILHLDAPTPGGGVPFDWSLVGDLGARHRLLLAGGLRPDNVAEAIAAVRPWGVDGATGTEASFGKKDPALLRRFISEAKAAGAELPTAHPPLFSADSDADRTPSR